MKFAILILSVGVLGSAVAHPGWMSSLTSTVSGASNAMKDTAVNAAKATTSTAVNAAKATTNAAVNAAGAAKNMTVNTAMAGVNLAKDVSMSMVNTGIGYFIQQVKNVVRMTGNNVIKIPDIAMKKGPISFNATNGYFKDVTTIVQAGKANVTTNGTTLEIDFPVKLNQIDIGYENVTVSVLGAKVGGGIKINIKNDTFIVHLRLKPGLSCALNLERVEVAVLSGFEIDFVNFTGEWVLEKAGNLIVNAVKGQIKSQVQSAVDSAIRSTLKEDSTICSKFIA